MEKTKNVIIALGNTGFNIAEACIIKNIANVDYFVIDSQTSHINLSSISKMNYIPIVADEKSGSGRNRERGAKLYEYHESEGSFAEMYKACEEAKSPVLVISSSAGGTGSGSMVPCCKTLIEKGVNVIPIIVCPNDNDPSAFHLNTEDLLLELDEIGVSTYVIFKNMRDDAEYTVINNDIVESIELMFGKQYKKTDLDSIDDSDLDVTLSVPGRIMTVTAKAQDIPSLKKELKRKLITGFQPMFTPEEMTKATVVTAFALESPFADQDFSEVFSDITAMVPNRFDGYKNIVKSNTADAYASIIISGLPSTHVKKIDEEFMEASTIGHGMKRNARPTFISKRKATISGGGKDTPKKFNWS